MGWQTLTALQGRSEEVCRVLMQLSRKATTIKKQVQSSTPEMEWTRLE